MISNFKIRVLQRILLKIYSIYFIEIKPQIINHLSKTIKIIDIFMVLDVIIVLANYTFHFQFLMKNIMTHQELKNFH